MSKLPIPFGNPNTYAGHSGVDYPVARGTVIPASGPGTVVTRAKNDAGGFYVFVKYDAIAPAVGYHHMDSHNGVPAVGTRVQEGSQLGFVGSLGARSTGPHLHSEVAGHRTTAGYWQFFDRNRVVGAGSGAGTGEGSKPSPAKPAPTLKPEEKLEEDDDMDRLMEIDKQVNGAFYVVNYRKGTAVRVWDPFQLALLREEIKWESTKEHPTIIEQPGPQPVAALRKLTIING